MKLERKANMQPSWTLDDTYDIYWMEDQRNGDYLRIVKKGQNPYKEEFGFTYKPKKINCKGEVIRQEVGLKNYENN